MSIDIELRNRLGEVVERFHGKGTLLEDALPPEDDESYHCLAYIDPCDVTVFNEPQVARLVTELGRRRDEVTGEQASYLDWLTDLARRAQSEPRFLAFIGD